MIGLIVRSRHTLAGFFQAASKLFGRQFTFFRCFCGPCFFAWFWFFGCFSDQRDKSLKGILTIFLLASEASGLDNQDAVFRHSLPRQFFKTVVNLGRKTTGLQGIETKLDCCGNFVHVLTTRTGCQNKIEGQIAFMDLNVGCNLNHQAILRYQGHLDKQQSHGFFLFVARCRKVGDMLWKQTHKCDRKGTP